MLIVPLHNIEFEDPPSQLVIEDKIILKPRSLIRKWQKLGLPHTYREMKDRLRTEFGGNIFCGDHYLLLLPLSKRDFATKRHFKQWDEVNRVRYILASSGLARSDFYSRERFGTAIESERIFDCAFACSGQNYASMHTLVSPADKFWVRFKAFNMKEIHFFPWVLPLFNSKLGFDSNWERDLKQAVVLAGKAVLSSEHWESFAWCFVAVERLLKKKGGGPVTEQFVARMKSLFGEFNVYSNDRWEGLIDSIYRKRNHLLHDGDVEKVSIEDSVIAESLLKNLLHILLKNKNLFSCKDELLHFCSKLEARRTLGLRRRQRGDFRLTVPIVDTRVKKIVENRRWY